MKIETRGTVYTLTFIHLWLSISIHMNRRLLSTMACKHTYKKILHNDDKGRLYSDSNSTGLLSKLQYKAVHKHKPSASDSCVCVHIDMVHSVAIPNVDHQNFILHYNHYFMNYDADITYLLKEYFRSVL